MEVVRKCFVTGFFLNVATLQPDGGYRTLGDKQPVHLHPSSVLFSRKVPAVLFNELVLTKKHYLRIVMEIEQSWLTELVPQVYNKKLPSRM